jgi:hypothetical protein
MRIDEIILVENQADLVLVIQDFLARAMEEDRKEIPMAELVSYLVDNGYGRYTPEQLIQPVDLSSYASSVNAEVIVPADQLSGDVPLIGDAEEGESPEERVNTLATQAAMSGIKR